MAKANNDASGPYDPNLVPTLIELRHGPSETQSSPLRRPANSSVRRKSLKMRRGTTVLTLRSSIWTRLGGIADQTEQRNRSDRSYHRGGGSLSPSTPQRRRTSADGSTVFRTSTSGSSLARYRIVSPSSTSTTKEAT